MSSVTAVARDSSVVVEIGGLPIRLRCNDPAFLLQIHERYAGYVSSTNEASFDFDLELAPPGHRIRGRRSERHVPCGNLADGARRFSRRI